MPNKKIMLKKANKKIKLINQENKENKNPEMKLNKKAMKLKTSKWKSLYKKVANNKISRLNRNKREENRNKKIL